jgi:hypothetical protein
MKGPCGAVLAPKLLDLAPCTARGHGHMPCLAYACRMRHAERVQVGRPACNYTLNAVVRFQLGRIVGGNGGPFETHASGPVRAGVTPPFQTGMRGTCLAVWLHLPMSTRWGRRLGGNGEIIPPHRVSWPWQRRDHSPASSLMAWNGEWWVNDHRRLRSSVYTRPLHPSWLGTSFMSQSDHRTRVTEAILSKSLESNSHRRQFVHHSLLSVIGSVLPRIPERSRRPVLNANPAKPVVEGL